MWRRPTAHDALRGRTFTADPQREMVVAEGVGCAGGSAARDTSSHRRGRQAPGCGFAPAEKCPHGDDGWGEFAMAADPAADQRQGRPKDCTAPSFSSHHEAAWRRPRREARAPCGLISRSAIAEAPKGDV